MPTPAESKQQLDKLLSLMYGVDILNDSNYKFMLLLGSRLVENNIPVSDAIKIASFAEYDVSCFDEEDDFLGEVAIEYAEFCARVYKRLVSIGFNKDMNAEMIRRFFNPLGKFATKEV